MWQHNPYAVQATKSPRGLHQFRVLILWPALRDLKSPRGGMQGAVLGSRSPWPIGQASSTPLTNLTNASQTSGSRRHCDLAFDIQLTNILLPGAYEQNYARLLSNDKPGRTSSEMNMSHITRSRRAHQDPNFSAAGSVAFKGIVHLCSYSHIQVLQFFSIDDVFPPVLGLVLVHQRLRVRT